MARQGITGHSMSHTHPHPQTRAPVPHWRLHAGPHARGCSRLRQLHFASCARGLAQQVAGALLPPVHLLHLQQPEADLPRQLLAVTPALQAAQPVTRKDTP